MSNFIDDGVNFGFGLFAYSRDKIEQIVEKLVDAGKVERKDAQGFAHNMIQTGEEQRREVRNMVNEQVRSELQALGLTQEKPLTAEQIRQIIREELQAKPDASDK